MDRETLLLVAIVMLTVAALAVGVSGFVLLARDRTAAPSLAPSRPAPRDIPRFPRSADMLELLDLRERGERLDATRLETDPTVADTVAGILQRVFVEGDDVLIELAHRFDGADLARGRRARDRRGVRRRPSARRRPSCAPRSTT